MDSAQVIHGQAQLWLMPAQPLQDSCSIGLAFRHSVVLEHLHRQQKPSQIKQRLQAIPLSPDDAERVGAGEQAAHCPLTNDVG